MPVAPTTTHWFVCVALVTSNHAATLLVFNLLFLVRTWAYCPKSRSIFPRGGASLRIQLSALVPESLADLPVLPVFALSLDMELLTHESCLRLGYVWFSQYSPIFEWMRFDPQVEGVSGTITSSSHASRLRR